ncbi:sine oculis-binding protein homolog isoform X1 [Esox lucius]|uniref:sine oculis-binding protein homolog isoform X1 n=1 Tax=Esox lucius TaxID=8010 RepID=UPI0009734261|nr:sine oculis-binding protein homolog isoform X1 [Esox lucius]
MGVKTILMRSRPEAFSYLQLLTPASHQTVSLAVFLPRFFSHSSPDCSVSSCGPCPSTYLLTLCQPRQHPPTLPVSLCKPWSLSPSPPPSSPLPPTPFPAPLYNKYSN